MDIRFRGWIATLIFIPGIQSAVAGADRVYTQPWYDFLDQSEMTLSLKNYWARLSEDETESRKVHNAWGQGAEVSFHSGDIAGILGADVTWTKAVKLAASDYFDTRGVLYDSRHQSNKRSAAGYQKFTQRNLRLQYKFADTDLKARVGWMPLKNFGVITASRRLSLTSYSGWYGDISYNNYWLQGGIMKKSMSRSSPENVQFMGNDRQTIRSLSTIDLRRFDKQLELSYAWGESRNYLSRHILQGTLKPTDSLALNAQVYLTRALAQYRAMPAVYRDFDGQAQHYTLEALTNSNDWQTRWSVSYTSAPKRDKVGTYPYHMSKNSRGTFNGMSKAGNDYNRDRETVLSGMVGYQLTPEINSGFIGTVARFSYQSVPVTTGELNFFTRWNPARKLLSNLSVSTMFGPGWSYKTGSGKTPVLKEGRFQRANSFAGELVAEYKFGLY
ncbi:OprD family outer membrane porin [Tatumella citrea]|uniref:Outer membrane porin, OprD family n=1 Tax=Tatumella citrea TaxID=53336 RepID=A0A1Y0L386_TATCI|nr:OprD family outer membrane porin [Tatumella citrea]ARU92467.1 hypothetical protein A7K98_00825 [Tatumella citrea]ARU96502.1 hypothetical protein A7K99_00825 [Tatumella citrea]